MLSATFVSLRQQTLGQLTRICFFNGSTDGGYFTEINILYPKWLSFCKLLNLTCCYSLAHLRSLVAWHIGTTYGAIPELDTLAFSLTFSTATSTTNSRLALYSCCTCTKRYNKLASFWWFGRLSVSRCAYFLVQQRLKLILTWSIIIMNS